MRCPPRLNVAAVFVLSTGALRDIGYTTGANFTLTDCKTEHLGALPMTKHLLLVAGNIGAGKTTITERIATRLGWEAAYETVSDNPVLPDFYADMRKWSFPLQVYFLGDRAEMHRRMAALPRSAIIDRSIYEDAHIFARALDRKSTRLNSSHVNISYA